MSNYWSDWEDDTVRENVNEPPCSRCKGLGIVVVHGQETDCIDCGGYG